MHDRTVNGEVLVFGNQGALFMNAMTWWDHRTESVWSQPWGRAIAGPLKGTELGLLPSQLAPWKTWREVHPNTLALDREALSVHQRAFGEATFHRRYVIGVTLGDSATAFPYELAEEAGVTNDLVGPHPVVIYVNPETQGVYVYLRQVEDRILTLTHQDDLIQDQETGSTWQMERGLAVEGPLQGQVLRSVPYIPAFPNAWRDFFPASRWFDGVRVAPAPTVEASTPASPPPTEGEGNADVEHVRAVQAADGTWTFHVTVQHPDTGWEDYADGWDIVAPDGTAVKPDADSPFTRLLLHPHVGEQPFTRSQSGIVLPPDVTQVRVRAHDLVAGFGGREVMVDLTLPSGEGFEVEAVP